MNYEYAGFIAAFISAPQTIIDAAMQQAEEAGTAFTQPVITFGDQLTQTFKSLSGWMGAGLSSIVATGVMFIFAILFFSLF